MAQPREIPLPAIRRELRAAADPERAKFVQGYFKTGKGEYAEGDRFLGVAVPALRRMARTHRDASLANLKSLLSSKWHEERALSLLVLVDCSAEYIVGAHVGRADMKLLEKLAKSKSVWERRIAVLASRTALKRGDFGPTLALAKALLDDTHDLIHKAVGWMLREIADKDRKIVEAFLKKHGERMPRTMLRYAIEKFPPDLRQRYLGVRKRAP